jgi:lipopolysaccharide transport system permease protein
MTVVEPSRGWPSLRLGELWQYRELLYFLAWRDVKVQYAQAALGVAWALLQPLATVLVFSFVFGRLAGLTSEGLPYPLYALAALLPWQLFAGALTRASTSLVTSANLLSKVYFPRLAIPLAATSAGVVDLGVSLALLIVLMLLYGVRPGPAILVLPFLVVLALLAAFAVGLWLSALNVQYRDVQHAVPFMIQIWFFVSPVAYSAESVPEGIWRLLYGLNPMVGIIQGFRWALLGTRPPGAEAALSGIVLAVVLVTGLFYFRRMERTFADVV